jgi:hypothetical protein
VPGNWKISATSDKAFIGGQCELIGLIERALAEAFAQGQLRSPDLKRIRALVYGLARMIIDGHFPRWGVTEADAERTSEPVIDLFIDGIARRPGAAARYLLDVYLGEGPISLR